HLSVCQLAWGGAPRLASCGGASSTSKSGGARGNSRAAPVTVRWQGDTVSKRRSRLHVSRQTDPLAQRGGRGMEVNQALPAPDMVGADRCNEPLLITNKGISGSRIHESARFVRGDARGQGRNMVGPLDGFGEKHDTEPRPLPGLMVLDPLREQ